MRLRVDQDCAVTPAAAQGELIDAENARRDNWADRGLPGPGATPPIRLDGIPKRAQ